MTDDRDRAGELLEYLDVYAAGFGTVVITAPGFRWVGSIDDLREAMRRSAAPPTDPTAPDGSRESPTDPDGSRWVGTDELLVDDFVLVDGQEWCVRSFDACGDCNLGGAARVMERGTRVLLVRQAPGISRTKRAELLRAHRDG